MATIHDYDGYDDYPTAQLAREHPRTVGAVTIGAGGRNGGTHLICTGRKAYACRAVPISPPGELVIGAYLTFSALDCYFADFRDATKSQICFYVGGDGSISAYRFTSSVYESDFGGSLQWNDGYRALLGSSAAGVVAAGQGANVQLRVLVSDTVGVIGVMVNGALVLTLTGQDTRNGIAGISNVLLGNGNDSTHGSGNVTVDDLWLADDYVGDMRADSHYEISDGPHQDGTPSTGVDHYACVDETSPNDDTDYVALANAGDRECYGIEAFKNSGAAIAAVMIVLDAKKVDAGGATLGAHIHGAGSPGADYDAAGQGLTTAYTRIKQLYQTDPDSGSPETAWDEAGFEALNYGYKKVA